ncbi:MAG: prolyl oligopeptidase family serine peptidase [Rhodothermales bacterium]|nr:prolyl oligopeptidase family serine peptidase [Rhodothermales bacterium]
MLVLATALPAAAQDGPFTLDQVLSAPFPSGLTAAPGGEAVAWVQNDRGVRNLWVAAPPDYRARQLTAYTEDDGQALGSLAFTPDAAHLVYVRGGAPNRQGDLPNPTSDPGGAERALWRIDLGGGEPVRIGEGSSPAVSPRGDAVAFTQRGQIWHAPLDGSAEPSVLVQARGGLGSLRWSPDGSRLAFVSSRGTHRFVGVYDLGAGTLRWMAPSTDRDSNPAWSPDGARIVFLREPASTAVALFQAEREAQPWSLLVADAATGTAQTVFTAAAGMGSAFRGVVAENQVLWTASGHLVFPWEREGWTHLYAVPASGGAARLLTPRDGEVEDVALAPDGRTVVYSSNQGDIDRRHLWRVDPAGGAPQPLTTGDGIEWAPTPLADGTLAFLRSDARVPAHAAIMPPGGTARALAPVPEAFPDEHLVVPQAVTFTAADGMEIPGQLFLPPEPWQGQRRPAVVFFHGGSRRQMLLGWHYRGYYHNAYALNQYLASRGFVVLSVNYRSGIGYGMAFREALGYGAGGGSEFFDVLGAGLYLKNRPDVDGERIGLWGGSYGGYLTALGLARASDLFAAGVDIHGVHDWNVGIQTFVPSYEPLEDPEAARVAFQASPMAHLDTWRSPVLVIHGDDDRNVSFVETVALVEALRERGVEVEQLVFPDEVHGFLTHRRWLDAYHAAADFLLRRLGDAE